MMEDFFQNMLQVNKTIIPVMVISSFDKAFPNAINVEWYQNGDIYEAVFYEKDLEKITFIDNQGNIIETKINLSISLLPSSIVKNALKHGEIMNSILITSKGSITYEIIIREQNLNRYLIEFDAEGLIFNKRML